MMRRMPRLLQVVTTTQRRGAEVFAADLEVALARRGWDVETVALEDPRRDAAGTGRLDPARLGELRRRAGTVDVVAAHGSTTLVAVAAATAGTSTPFVYRSIGDPAHWSAAGLRRLRSTALLRFAAAVVVLWPGAATTLRARRGLDPQRIRVIPNGAPAGRGHVAGDHARARARAELGLAPEGPVIVFVGALSAEKRVDRAVRALVTLEDARLVVVGDGPLRDDLEDLARRLAPGRVRFTGAFDDVGPAYAAADALVLPSTTEGMPAVLIEAALSGVPAVATDVGGVAEVVVDGCTGALVDRSGAGLAPAVASVAADRDRLGAAARQHCLARFEIEVVADRWHELLHDVAGNPS
jgi:glycosyltransferase involved in cell wall biosynthesis